MTIEEAIEQLKLNKPSAYTELREAIDMAIEVLERQIPKEPEGLRHFRSFNSYAGFVLFAGVVQIRSLNIAVIVDNTLTGRRWKNDSRNRSI